MFNKKPQKYIEDLPSNEEIYLRYFGEFEVGRHYLSPFREEGNASFIFYWDGDILLWNDLGDIEKGGDSIKFVMKKYSLSYHDAINKIYYDFEGKKVKKKFIKLKPLKKNVISCTYVNLDEKHLNYFKNFKITQNTLDYFNVKQVYRLYKNRTLIPKADLSYVYLFSPNSYKIYQPESKYKWMSRNIYGQIQGWDQIKQINFADIIFITSSLKDVMIFHELGYPAVAPSNENVILTQDTINDIKTKCNKIYVAHDNDTTGVMASLEMTKMYDLNYFNIPKRIYYKNKEIKDPSDYAEAFGLKSLNKLLIEKFKRDQQLF